MNFFSSGNYYTVLTKGGLLCDRGAALATKLPPDDDILLGCCATAALFFICSKDALGIRRKK